MENVNFRLGRRTFLARRTYVSGSGNVENEGRFVCQSPIVFQYIESAFSTKKNLHKNYTHLLRRNQENAYLSLKINYRLKPCHKNSYTPAPN